MYQLSKINHRSQDLILVKPEQFLSNPEYVIFVNKIKTIAGNGYTKTFGGFYVPYGKLAFEELKKLFGEDNLRYAKKPGNPATQLGEENKAVAKPLVLTENPSKYEVRLAPIVVNGEERIGFFWGNT